MSEKTAWWRALGASLRLAALMFIADPQWLVPSLIAPVVFALVSYELFLGSGPWFVLYTILGAGMMSMWGQTLYGSGWATGQDRVLGTLEPTLSSPAPYIQVVMGRVIWNTLAGLPRGADRVCRRRRHVPANRSLSTTRGRSPSYSCSSS